MICSVCKQTLELLLNLHRLSPESAKRYSEDPDDDVCHHKDFKSFRSSLEQKCYACTALWESSKVDERKSWEDAWINYGWENDPKSVSAARFEVPPSEGLYKKDCTVYLRLYLPPGTLGATPAIISQTLFGLKPQIAQSSSRMKRFRTIFSISTLRYYWRLAKHTQELEEPRFYLSVGPLRGQTRPVLGPTTASSLDLAKTWLDSCVAHHPRCRPRVAVKEATWLPTRLLYFTGRTVQLIETKETKPTTPYMTVTHRWGFAEDEKMMLNKRTYPSFRAGIPLSSMPRLFQEVISVALHLGANYIWIDALCIFQDKDDQTDWHQEASQMRKVYSNSFCNICAADATSCSDTLFSQHRDPKEEILPQAIHLNLVSDPSSSSSSTPAISISSQPTSHLSPSIMSRLPLPKLTYAPKTTAESFTLTNLSLWTSQVSQALVNTRAWVFQERVLAPRILHFGRRQLFWECSCWQSCEAFPLGVPWGMRGGDMEPAAGFKRYLTYMLNQQKPSDGVLADYIVWKFLMFKRYLTYKLNQQKPPDGDLADYIVWKFLMEAYSQTSLSFPSDKLIAVSGLAKLFHSSAKSDEYLAGLWRRHLEGELLWVNPSSQYFGAKTTTKRPEKYRAPSWSWASIDGPLLLGSPATHENREFRIRVEDVQLSHLTQDKTGEVTGGWLRLRGRLLETDLVRVSCRDGTVGWMVKLEGVSVLGEVSHPAYGDSNLRVCLDVVQEDFKRENEEGLLFSMVAATNMWMLLFKLVDRENGVFQRLGIMKVSGHMSRRVSEVKRDLDKPTLPCVKLHDDGQHSIIVI